MSTRDNGWLVTPDWQPTPKPSPFDAAGLSSDDNGELPERFELGEN